MSARPQGIVRSTWATRRRKARVLAAIVVVGLLGWIVADQVTGRVPSGWQEHRVGAGGSIAVPDDWEATTFDPPDGEGACQREDAAGVLVAEAGLWDACPDRSEPPRVIVGWSAVNIAPDDLEDAESVEVAGEPALRIDEPRLVDPDDRRFNGEALLVPSLELHLLIHDEVDDSTAERIAATLHRPDGPDRDLAHVLEHPRPDGGTQLWVLDADARAYPLARHLPELDISRPWPRNGPEQVAHAWVTDDQLRLTAGGPRAGSDTVEIHEGDIGPMDFSEDGRDLFWIEQSDEGPVVGHARWDWEQPTELLDHLSPEVETARAEGLPSDVEIAFVDHRHTDPPRVEVSEVTDDQWREWALELEQDGDDWGLPDEPRFVDSDP